MMIRAHDLKPVLEVSVYFAAWKVDMGNTVFL